MAATVTSAWAKPGAWALDSEEHEKELQNEDKNHRANGGDAADFPSLAAAKTKKKKPQKIPLSEFNNPTPAKRLTIVDLTLLPTGPRERTAEELDQSRLGGGFRSYGDESSKSRWGSSRASSDEPRRNGDSNRELGPSRADEVDDWGASKKSLSSNGFERRERGGFFGSGSESRADDSESWVSKKSFVPSEGRRFESMRERRVAFESNGAADSDNWVKKKEEEGKKFGAFDSLRERRGGFDSATNGAANSDYWGKKSGDGNIGTERRRLNLQPRTLPVGDSQQDGSVTVVKPKGLNPFGAARPREEVLKEKGQDWKEIDEKLESTKIKEMGSANDGKRGFGIGNGRLISPESQVEKSWRKTDSAADDVRPPSADKAENGLANEAEDVQE
ncbi:hypothetical protein CsSME_00025570 [Camellia sinensis var. sinensis]|uniref:eukaryotic translation initiation factor 4B3-like n=1 Tax=Camellia sinensis TaxID=4442 RepID=UPI001036EEB1|nr:eukaryotic translation initiation factor 4B3-like [Camellia sinensis]